jgi:hypothetical protein
MLYEKLNPEMRSTVDAFASCIRSLPWEERSGLLAEAARPFEDRFEAEAARLALQGFLTAVLERLGPGEVTDPHQAHLLSKSLNPEHRARAEAYLARCPDVGKLADLAFEAELVN